MTAESKPKRPTKRDESKNKKTEDSKKMKKAFNSKDNMKHKFEQYFNSNFQVCDIKPHQVCDITIYWAFDV